MKFHRRAILSFLPIAFASGALQSNPSGSPSILSDTTDVCSSAQGRTSKCEVQLDIPAPCVSADGTSSCPIVFFFHGAGGTNRAFKNSSKVHENNVIGVYPTGEDGWNTGPKNSNSCTWDDFGCTSDPDEGAFIAGIITTLRNMGATGNIYAIGSSNGGALANRLGSNAGDDIPIKGFVSLVTQLLSDPERSGPGVLNYNQPSSGRQNGRPVSVLNIMGTADGVIPYEGGSSGVFGGNTNFELYSALDSMDVWSDYNGCGSRISQAVLTSHGDGTGTFYEYPNCSNGAIVEHYAIHGGEHNAGGSSIDTREAREVQYDFIRRCEEHTPPAPTTSTPPTPAPVPISTPPPVVVVVDDDDDGFDDDSCEDDASWHGKFSENHNCDWISQNSGTRCSFVSSEGVLASEGCPVTCNTCPPPDDDDNDNTIDDDDDTDDNDECFDDATWHGKFSTAHNCEFVGQNPEVRCGWENAEGFKAIDACPVSCDSC